MDNLEAFIIPPPPQVKRQPLAETQEAKVRGVAATRERDKISPKIASLQQQLLTSSPEEASPSPEEAVRPVVPPPPPPRTAVSQSVLLKASRKGTAILTPARISSQEEPAIPSYEFGSEKEQQQQQQQPPKMRPQELERVIRRVPPSSSPPMLPPRLSPPKQNPRPQLPTKVVRGTEKASKVAPPLPPPPAVPLKSRTVVRIKENGVTYPAAEEEDDVPPALPLKTAGRRLPTAPAVTSTSGGFVLANGLEPSEIYSNSEFDPEDSSLEGTSVDDDDENHAGTLIGAFSGAESAVRAIIRDVRRQEVDGVHPDDGTNLDVWRDRLTSESRQFVTASKLFVKSATESESRMRECLSHCVSTLQRMASCARECGRRGRGTDDGWTRNTVDKVAEVAETFLSTVQAAAAVAAADSRQSSTQMGVLMKRATSLASVLTNLMRTLRVFN